MERSRGFHQYRAYDLAEEAYQNVIQHPDSANYPSRYFYLGQVLKQKGQYQNAIQAFNTYLADSMAVESSLQEEALKEVDDCQWALSQYKDEDIEIERMGEAPNTCQSETGIIQRGQKVYYTSYAPVNQDESDSSLEAYFSNAHIWQGDLDENGIITNVNTLFPEMDSLGKHVAQPSIHPKGDWIFFTECLVGENCHIYKRNKISESEWGPSIKLPAPINVETFSSSMPHLALSADGVSLLFFSSDRSGGRGGRDIYVSKEKADGTWTEPRNIAAINTEGDELTPHFSSLTESCISAPMVEEV